MSLDLPDFSVGADVDIPATEPDVTIPPVMLNSHLTNLKADIDTSARGRLVNLFRRQVGTGVRSGGFRRYALPSGDILGRLVNSHLA